MSTLGELINRVSFLLQDEEEASWSRDRIRRAILSESAQLARRRLFGQIVWLQAQASKGRYSAEDTPPGEGISERTVSVTDVLYDGRSLREVSEENFARGSRRWEEEKDVPFYWTTDLQSLTGFRISPEPVQDGPNIPVFPAAPLAMPIDRNLVAWTFEDALLEDASEDQEVSAPEAYEEVLVMAAVGSLCGDVSDWGDQVKAASYTQLAELMRNLLESSYGD